jgi:glycosyltransferase involved in cell wall biosynthesis
MPNRKPRIAILHYAAPPTIGGVEATIAAHARLFADQQYAVKIITGRGKPFDSRVPVQVIRNVDSKAPRVLKATAELARGIVSENFAGLVDTLTHQLARALAHTDVLIAHNALSLHKNLALTTALKNLSDTGKIQLIAWCHDFAWSDPQYANEMHPGLPWDLLRQPWTNVRYVVVSEARKIELRMLWQSPHAIAVVPPGIDAAKFLGVTKQTLQWAHELNLFDAAPLLLLPARLTRRKNIERAIEIIGALNQRGVPAKLLVTGPPGPHNPTNAAYLTHLRELRAALRLESSVIFLYEFGGVTDATMRDLYLLADALLFPSEREGFGIPLLEAGIARLPIFCADLPPFREIAQTHAHYFAPSESTEEIAARIADYFASDPLYRMKRRVLEKYNWGNIFTQHIEPLVYDK